MRQIRPAAAMFALLLGLVGAARAAPKEPLAVVTFRVRGEGLDAGLGEIVAELFAVKVGPHFRVLERVQVSKIIETQQFQYTDLVEDPSKAVKVGKLARARYILVGSLNKIGGTHILVAKVLDCESGEQFKGTSTTFDDIGTLSEAVDKIVRSMKFGASPDGEPEVPTLPEGIVRLRPGLYRCERDRAVMVHVEPGTFTMGAENAGPAARPVHKVRMKGFFIDRTEVTNRMFARFLNFRGKDVDDEGRPMIYPDPRIGLVKEGDDWKAVRGYEDFPVVRVTWYGASAYATWARKSLPTEAQWEYAARGASGFLYPWGNAAPKPALAVYDRRPPHRSGRAGALRDGVSPFGCLDMAGNVSEWCLDWFDAKYYEVSRFDDPVNLERKDERVLRGGSWYDPAEKILSAYRRRAKAHFADDTVGFRCVKNLD